MCRAKKGLFLAGVLGWTGSLYTVRLSTYVRRDGSVMDGAVLAWASIFRGIALLTYLLVLAAGTWYRVEQAEKVYIPDPSCIVGRGRSPSWHSR